MVIFTVSKRHGLLATVHFIILTMNTFSPPGGTALTIQGSGFGASVSGDDAITIGDEVATVTSYSDTQVEVELPSLAPGDYILNLWVEGKGYADVR